jgi:hypothetical protein
MNDHSGALAILAIAIEAIGLMVCLAYIAGII